MLIIMKKCYNCVKHLFNIFKYLAYYFFTNSSSLTFVRDDQLKRSSAFTPTPNIWLYLSITSNRGPLRIMEEEMRK